MATQPTEEGTFSLFEEGGFASSKGHSGYRHQPNKPPPPTLGDRCQFLMTGEVEEDDSPTWVAPASMGFLVLMSFIAFVLSCVGVDMARSNSRSVSQMKSDLATLKKQVVSQQQEHHSSTYDCSQGDIIWGQTPLEGSVAWYQLIGGSKATLTWFEALRDAEVRCYNGVRGSLAWIESPEEDAFLQELIRSNDAFKEGSNAWLGGSDLTREGTFTWKRPNNQWQTFYQDGSAYEGAYTNWAEGEPNEGSGGENKKSEDCVAKYGGGDGKWNDVNCYYNMQFFIVKYAK